MFTTPEHSLTRQFGSWTLFLFALVVSLLILINSTSRFFNAENPALALRINPLNAEARINLLALILSKDRTPDQFEVLEKLAISGTTLEPMDARFYSLLGMTHEILGEANAAQILYRHALRLLPTEIQALSRRFVFNFNDGNYVEAVSIVDIFSRRWRKHWNLISPHLPNLLDNEMAYDEAINRFSKQKNGIQILVSSLINQSNSLDLAHRMIMDWHKQGEKNLRNSINQLSNKLVANGQENKAYRLFRLTLNANQEKETGYVFNSNFNLDPSGNMFDWKLAKQSGLSMDIKSMLHKSNTPEKLKDRVLETRFLDSPIRFSSVLQNLKLPPSDLTLNLTYSTRNLKTPKPIKLAIECRKTHQELAVVEFFSGDVAWKTAQTRFKIPNNCDLQQLRMFNGNIVESWKNRYSGSLLIHNISIKLGR